MLLRLETIADWAQDYREHVKAEEDRRILEGDFPEIEWQKLVMSALMARQMFRETKGLIDEDEVPPEYLRRIEMAERAVKAAVDAAYDARVAREVLERRAAAERGASLEESSDMSELARARARREQRAS